MSVDEPDRIGTDMTEFDTTAPSVHEYQTDIDIADVPYEDAPSLTVYVTMFASLGFAVNAAFHALTIQGPIGVITAVLCVITSAIFGYQSVAAELQCGRVDERNRALLTERVNLVRPIVEREFGVSLPDDYRPNWMGRPAFISSIPTGTSSVVLSAGMTNEPTTVLIRFYPLG